MDSIKKCQYLADVKQLNEDLKAYVLEMLGKSAYVDFTPTFNDYIKQLKSLDDKHNSVVSTQSSLPNPIFSQPAIPKPSFSQPIFKQPQPIFTQPNVPQPLFAPPSFSQPSFSQPGGFSQSIFTPPTFAQPNISPQANTTTGDTEDTEDTPPEPNCEKFVETGHKLEVRCKLYQRKKKVSGELETHLIGVGMLYAKPMDEGKLQIIFRQDPDLRKVPLNEIITKTSVVRSLNKAVQMAFPDPAAGQPKIFIVKVATPNEADRLYNCVTFKDETTKS